MENKRILCFGDSLTWGYDPVTRTRIGMDERWTGVLRACLGEGYTVIEEGQNGRTIATDDPAEGEKNAMRYIVPCLESHDPLDLAIVMLGTNDLKHKFAYTADDIAGEMRLFLEKVLAYNHFHMGGRMKVLLLAPPVTGELGKDSWMAEGFDFPRAEKTSARLPALYHALAESLGCAFFDTTRIVKVSPFDGVHLDAPAHGVLGRAIYEKLIAEKLI
ncbi:MAG: SGNH/GDSL hydrolase family protein [Oscillospiraceae bacterium]|nr:SGNH/GDSL hydrolase family protein [Oscillospiraceae bacterium]